MRDILASDRESDWMRYSRCSDSGTPELFYPEPHATAARTTQAADEVGHYDKKMRGKLAQVAKAYCGECPVKLSCLEYAVKYGERWGIWGGTLPAERGWRNGNPEEGFQSADPDVALFIDLYGHPSKFAQEDDPDEVEAIAS